MARRVKWNSSWFPPDQRKQDYEEIVASILDQYMDLLDSNPSEAQKFLSQFKNNPKLVQLLSVARVTKAASKEIGR